MGLLWVTEASQKYGDKNDSGDCPSSGLVLWWRHAQRTHRRPENALRALDGDDPKRIPVHRDKG